MVGGLVGGDEGGLAMTAGLAMIAGLVRIGIGGLGMRIGGLGMTGIDGSATTGIGGSARAAIDGSVKTVTADSATTGTGTDDSTTTVEGARGLLAATPEQMAGNEEVGVGVGGRRCLVRARRARTSLGGT